MRFPFFTKPSVKVGDVAPDFTLMSQEGTDVNLSQFRGQWVVLYFYPKDDTYGCIAESMGFKEKLGEFQGLNAVILGVSSDNLASHKRFASKFGLPFSILSDEGNNIRKMYGVPPTMGIIPDRVTFVIDPQGVVRYSFSSQFSPKSHVDESLAFLKGQNHH